MLHYVGSEILSLLYVHYKTEHLSISMKTIEKSLKILKNCNIVNICRKLMFYPFLYEPRKVSTSQTTYKLIFLNITGNLKFYLNYFYYCVSKYDNKYVNKKKRKKSILVTDEW